LIKSGPDGIEETYLFPGPAMSAFAAKKIPNFAAARLNMIEGQLRPNGVRDEKILSLLETLPRELFVPERLAGVAYMDESLPVAPGRFLLPPMVLARLLQAAAIGRDDKALDIAPATGYSTAALAKLAAQVVAVESDADLQRWTAGVLAALEIANVEVRLAPMQQGWKTQAPYDVIFINGAVDSVPDNLLLQLKDGGRLVTVVRHYGAAHAAHTGEARLYERSGETVTYRALFDANVALLPGFAADAVFEF
jgi:protein-L-isoaspartate(D-aspartate) O-methyltransferase